MDEYCCPECFKISQASELEYAFYPNVYQCPNCKKPNYLKDFFARSKLKLFVWDDFNSDYTKGLAFAIAENVEEAKKLIFDYLKKKGEPKQNYFLNCDPFWGDMLEYTINKIGMGASGGG